MAQTTKRLSNKARFELAAKRSRYSPHETLFGLPHDVWHKKIATLLAARDLLKLRLVCRQAADVANLGLDHLSYSRYEEVLEATNRQREYLGIKLPRPGGGTLYGFARSDITLDDQERAGAKLRSPWIIARMVVYKQREYSSLEQVRTLLKRCAYAGLAEAVETALREYSALRSNRAWLSEVYTIDDRVLAVIERVCSDE